MGLLPFRSAEDIDDFLDAALHTYTPLAHGVTKDGKKTLPREYVVQFIKTSLQILTRDVRLQFRAHWYISQYSNGKNLPATGDLFIKDIIGQLRSILPSAKALLPVDLTGSNDASLHAFPDRSRGPPRGPPTGSSSRTPFDRRQRGPPSRPSPRPGASSRSPKQSAKKNACRFCPAKACKNPADGPITGCCSHNPKLPLASDITDFQKRYLSLPLPGGCQEEPVAYLVFGF